MRVYHNTQHLSPEIPEDTLYGLDENDLVVDKKYAEVIKPVLELCDKFPELFVDFNKKYCLAFIEKRYRTEVMKILHELQREKPKPYTEITTGRMSCTEPNLSNIPQKDNNEEVEPVR